MGVATVVSWMAYPKVLGGADGVTVRVAEGVWLVSAWLMAVTVTAVLEVTVGAVKSPELETDPAVADQMTAVFVPPVTDAVNCWVPVEATVATVGERLMATLDGPHVPGGGGLLKPSKILPDPRLLLPDELRATPRPVPPVHVLLLIQPLVP